MTEHADQIVLEYLSRANDVAYRYLGSRERVDFMTRLRKRIEEHRAAAGGATEPAQVRKVLARFGDPEALVRRELRRLDEAGAEHATAPPVEPARPARGAEPAHHPAGQVEPAGPAGSPRPVGSPASADGGAADLETLFLRQPVEVGAIALLGVGGLLLPVPLWLFGAVAGVLSRVWTTREKVTGLLMPVLVAVSATAASGDLDDLGDLGTSGVPPLLRLAGPVGAGFLGWRLLRAVGARTVRLTRARARGR
jgi:hypothetical protein